MVRFAKRSCHSCGIIKDQPEMLRKTVQVPIGHSRKTFSKSELLFAPFSAKAANSVKRTFLSPNKRKHVRNRQVWMCYPCAGVASPVETAQRIEREKLEKERRREQLAVAQQQKMLAAEEKKVNHLRSLSRSGYLLHAIPQYLLSNLFLYFPLTDIYFRRPLPALGKYFSFYMSVLVAMSIFNGHKASAVLPALAFALYDYARAGCLMRKLKLPSVTELHPPPIPITTKMMS